MIIVRFYGRIGTIFGILPILHLGRRHKWVNPLMVKKERRVLTVGETELFFSYAKDTFYYNLYVVAIDTGMYGCNNETNSEGTPGI